MVNQRVKKALQESESKNGSICLRDAVWGREHLLSGNKSFGTFLEICDPRCLGLKTVEPYHCCSISLSPLGSVRCEIRLTKEETLQIAALMKKLATE